MLIIGVIKGYKVGYRNEVCLAAIEMVWIKTIKNRNEGGL